MRELREFFEKLSVLLYAVGLPGSLIVALLFWLTDYQLDLVYIRILSWMVAVLVFLWQVERHAVTLRYRRHRKQILMWALEYAAAVYILLATVFIWGDFLAHVHWGWMAGTVVVWLVYLHINNA